MHNHDLLCKALEDLMPKGGYSIVDEEIIIHEDGLSYGYTSPTIDVLNKAKEKILNNEPLEQELKELDIKVTRAVEDLIPETDNYLYPIVMRKRELRSNLIK